jgi:hypothetical protein
LHEDAANLKTDETVYGGYWLRGRATCVQEEVKGWAGEAEAGPDSEGILSTQLKPAGPKP